MTPPTVIPFNIIDEGYSHGGDHVEPLTVHIEVRAVESLDDVRLDAAVLAALAHHPLARARTAANSLTRVSRLGWGRAGVQE